MSNNKKPVILHCDMNNFFASVELLSFPHLQNKPVAVCGNPKNRRGIILAKNNIAKKQGVITAETIWSAKKKSPNLILLPSHYKKYQKYSKMINNIYYRFTDTIEPFSIDESWLDVTGSEKLFGSGKDIADKIRAIVKKELGLTLSVGVSYNKIFAKMGSNYKKPDATTVISQENFKELLWCMPVENMFMVGKSSANKLKKSGILTIGDLANTNTDFLYNLLGKLGLQLHNYSNGLDTEPVSKFSEREKIKSIGNGTTFKRDLININDFRTSLRFLSETVAYRLRHHQLKAKGLKIDIKDNLFNLRSHQKQFTIPTNSTEDIFKMSLDILNSIWKFNRPVRMITLTCINLIDEGSDIQLTLFDNLSDSKNTQIDKVIDEIKDKFGKKTVSFASHINNDLGLDIIDKD